MKDFVIAISDPVTQAEADRVSRACCQGPGASGLAAVLSGSRCSTSAGRIKVLGEMRALGVSAAVVRGLGWSSYGPEPIAPPNAKPAPAPDPAVDADPAPESAPEESGGSAKRRRKRAPRSESRPRGSSN